MGAGGGASIFMSSCLWTWREDWFILQIPTNDGCLQRTNCHAAVAAAVRCRCRSEGYEGLVSWWLRSDEWTSPVSCASAFCCCVLRLVLPLYNDFVCDVSRTQSVVVVYLNLINQETSGIILCEYNLLSVCWTCCRNSNEQWFIYV